MRVTRLSASIVPRNRTLFLLSVVWLLPSLLSLELQSSRAQAQDAVVLVGSGSSVPAILYNRWAQEYGKRNPKFQMRYVPVGTSEGIKQISHGAGDFSAGEALLTDKERNDGGLIELPAVLIGIVPIYNLPNIHQELRLSGEVLAEIFLGELKTWDAPSIAKLNPDVTLPSLRIQVINRPAGKGSNYVFTDFLCKVSPKFRAQIGVTASPKWPVGTPAERSSDMVDQVKNESGALGFVELQYAVKANASKALVLNPAGKFVRATADSLAAACAAVEAPRWNSRPEPILSQLLVSVGFTCALHRPIRLAEPPCRICSTGSIPRVSILPARKVILNFLRHCSPPSKKESRIYARGVQFDCHPEQAFLRSEGSGRAARCVAFFATQ
jgi:phosphate ABC transporter phosphate-binding protein